MKATRPALVALAMTAMMSAAQAAQSDNRSSSAGALVQLALQQCKGPSHNCGKPTGKCVTITTQVCAEGPRRPGGPGTHCHIEKQTSCT